MRKMRLVWLLVLSSWMVSCTNTEDTIAEVGQEQGFLTKGVYPFETVQDLDPLIREIGGAVRTMNMPTARASSWEAILHNYSAKDKLLLMKEVQDIPEAMQSRGHRAIGVTYNPSAEAGNYVPTILPERYDAFLYIDKTTALKSLSGTAASFEGNASFNPFN